MPSRRTAPHLNDQILMTNESAYDLASDVQN